MDYRDLNKDNSIKLTVKHLADKFGPDTFKIKDYWDADLCAIGLTDLTENHLIYISTYGKANNEFYVSLENLTASGDYAYEPVGNFDKVELEELERLFVRHLRVDKQ